MGSWAPSRARSSEPVQSRTFWAVGVPYRLVRRLASAVYAISRTASSSVVTGVRRSARSRAASQVVSFASFASTLSSSSEVIYLLCIDTEKLLS